MSITIKIQQPFKEDEMSKTTIKIYYLGTPDISALPDPERRKFFEKLYSEIHRIHSTTRAGN